MSIADNIRQCIISVRDDTGMSFSAVAAEVNDRLSLSGDDLITKDIAQKVYSRRPIVQTIEPETNEIYSDETTGEAPADRFRREFTDYWNPKILPVQSFVTSRRKVVASGDWHGNPNFEVLQAIIDEKPDEIILAGDLTNSEQASAHNDDAQQLNRLMKDEVGRTRGGIQTLVERTSAAIKVMRGNHDAWIRRALRAANLDWLLDVYGDPLDLLVRDIPRTEVISSQMRFKLPNGTEKPFAKTQFLMPVGDAVISHVNFTSKHPGVSVIKLAEWIQEWHRPLGLPEPSLLVQAHVHKIADLDKQGGFLRLIESGMGGEPSDEWYKMGYQPKWTPGALGITVFEQDLIGNDWVTDRKSIRLVRIGR